MREVPSLRTDIGHHRVHVVEGAVRISRVWRPALGERAPAAGEFHLAQVQPPQERRSFDQVRDRTRARADVPVVGFKRPLPAFRFELEQREMPRVMRRHRALAGPVGRTRFHPIHPLQSAPLHLEDVRDGVVRPDVARLELKGVQRRFLRAAVLAALLEAEREHGEHSVIPGNLRRPGGQHGLDAAPQRVRVAPDVIEGMCYLQRERVPRIFVEQAAEEPARGLVLSRDRRGERGKIAPLARVEASSVDIAENVRPYVRPRRVAAPRRR